MWFDTELKSSLELLMVILASQSRYRKKQLRDFGIPFKAVRPVVDESALKAQWLRENGKPKTPAQFAKLVKFLSLQKAGSIANLIVIRTLKSSYRSNGFSEVDGSGLAEGKTNKKSKNAASKSSSHKYANSLNPLKTFKSTKVASSNDLYIIGSDQMAIVDSTKLDKPGNHTKAVSQLRKLRGKTHFLITAVTVLRIDHNLTVKAKTEVVTAKITLHKFSNAEMIETLKADKPYDCAGSYKLERSGLRLVKKIVVSDSSAIIGLPLIATYDLLKSLGYKG